MNIYFKEYNEFSFGFILYIKFRKVNGDLHYLLIYYKGKY